MDNTCQLISSPFLSLHFCIYEYVLTHFIPPEFMLTMNQKNGNSAVILVVKYFFEVKGY